MTVFLGGGFAAKYLHGGGNFSVPLQWMLGLRRLKMDAFWLEHLPSEGNTRDDERKIDNFRRQLRAHGLGGRYIQAQRLLGRIILSQSRKPQKKPHHMQLALASILLAIRPGRANRRPMN